MIIVNGCFVASTAKDYDLPVGVVEFEFESATCYEQFYQRLEAILLDNLFDTL